LEEKVIEHVISNANTIKSKVDKDEYEKLEKKTFDVKKGK